VDLLAALPSVVVGIWGIFVLSPVAATWSLSLSNTLSFIPIFRNEFSNAEGAPFIAAWTIAVMIIPIITSVSREVMGRVDKDLISAAIALGSTSFSTMRRIIVPNAKSGILGGILLGLGRALGETVAIFFVLNLVFEVNLFQILEPKGGNVASLIIAKFGEATPEELNALMAAGVVLFILTLVVNMIATSIVQRAERRMAS
jgi:phosphate transport system permease protein